MYVFFIPGVYVMLTKFFSPDPETFSFFIYVFFF